MADTFLDATGLLCPLPVLKARKRMKDLASGEVLTVHATDPGAERDFPAFCETQGHELIKVAKDGDILVFEIRKG